MIIKTFFHVLPDGTKGKFTISDQIINENVFYFAQAVDIESEYYQNLSKEKQETFYGVKLTDGNQFTIYYKDANRLENDIIDKYGPNYLKSEI